MTTYLKRFKAHKALLAIAAALLLALVAVSAVLAAGPLFTVEEEDPSLPASPPISGPFEVNGEGAQQVSILGRPADLKLAPAPPDAKPGSSSALALSLSGQGASESVPAHEVERSLGEPITVAEVSPDACVGTEGLSTCGSPQEIIAGRVVAVELCSPQLAKGSARVLGMAPDGVRAVEVTLQDGSSVALPVGENVYEGSVEGVPKAIGWSAADGRSTSVPAPVPPGYSLSDCGS